MPPGGIVIIVRIRGGRSSSKTHARRDSRTSGGGEAWETED